jgi:hypothetical protein
VVEYLSGANPQQYEWGEHAQHRQDRVDRGGEMAAAH